MAQVFHTTPMLKGAEALTLLKYVLTSEPETEKNKKHEKALKKIRTYKR